MRKFLSISALAVLSACGASNIEYMDDRSSMSMALSVKPDGYSSVDNVTGKKFKIISTAVNKNKLCRVVSIETGRSFVADTYCKVKGGKWH